jgi:hypothetical protein
MEKIEIMDVPELPANDSGNLANEAPQIITLLVTHQQAKDLNQAKRRGTVDLVLNPIIKK